MRPSELPVSAGSLIRYLDATIGATAVLAPSEWKSHNRTFSQLKWCTFYDFGEPEVEVLEPVRMPKRGLTILHVAEPPSGGKARKALGRPGAVALLDEMPYTFCPYRLDSSSGEFEGGAWVNPNGIRRSRDVERSGIELVPGML